MTPLDAALAYAAERGWHVAPIAPGTKWPRITAWQDAATTDPATITAWWTEQPADGVSIVTGEASAIFVVDVDPRHGGDDTLADLEATHEPLPDTVRCLTGGGGTHHYFRMPDGVRIRNDAGISLGPGLDVRGDGGQVVAPPTLHPETGIAYTWDLEADPFDGVAVADPPLWLVELLTAPDPSTQPRRERAARPAGELLPGDHFAATHTWPELLEPDGWTLHSARADRASGAGYELWTRPGKDRRAGASATLYYGGSDVLKVFTTNPPAGLRTGETYTRFGYWTATRHHGDFEEAARAWRRHMNDENDRLLTGAPLTPPTPPAAPATSTSQAPRRPCIVWNGRGLEKVTDDATNALVAANEPPSLFVRAGLLARLRQDEDERPVIDEMQSSHVKLRLAEVAHWHRALKEGGHTVTSPPDEVAKMVLAAGEWSLPALAGVVELPVLRPDGTFATEHGYDPATRLYHWHRGTPYATIPERPTRAELAAAVALVDEALCDFPFDTSADRANAWGLLLTPLVRAIVGQVPMALVDAPEPGTGKGLLVKLAAIITIGRAAALMPWPATDEELEKKITASLMAGQTMIIFDNVEGIIRSGTLAAVLTADSWQGRVLGASKVVMVPNRATWAATGNNIDVGGDLARRCYRIRLDARQAQPWKRSGFRHPDLEAWVATNRGALLHALCTIVRSWWTAGRPAAEAIPAMGGYTPWVRTIGGILQHAGVADFLANLADFHATADADSQSWEAFLTAWSDDLGEQPMTVSDLLARMKDIYAGFKLKDALPDELGDPDHGHFAKRLSIAMRKRVGRHYGDSGVHLVAMPRDRRNAAIYAVTTRSMELLPEGDSPSRDGYNSRTPAPEARELEATPARGDSATRDDAKSAGVAEVVELLAGENPESENRGGGNPNNFRNSRTPARAHGDALSATADPLDDLFGGST